jgi:hypothetical protein
LRFFAYSEYLDLEVKLFMSSILGYTTSTSFVIGETVSIHTRSGNGTSAGTFRVSIYRIGTNKQILLSGQGNANATATPNDAYIVGCNWSVGFSFVIPNTWLSGIYVVHLETNDDESNIVFIVRGSNTSQSRILVQVPFATYQAYNDWGGKSLYDNSGDGSRSYKVSFNRPCTPVDVSGTWDAKEYENFVVWTESNGFRVDYASSLDIHSMPNLLNRYRLFVSVLHDEYWSKEMRDNVERFRDNGGNLCFLSANTCWWQVRFEDGNSSMVCHKDNHPTPDPHQNDILSTINWFNPPVNRPENTMTGVSFRNGAWWDDDGGSKPMERVAFTVRMSSHWVFNGTGLSNGDEFGKNETAGTPVSSIIGYETDATRYTDVNGIPTLSGGDGTPNNLTILATAQLSNKWKVEPVNPPSQRRATMGIYQRGGVVFTSGTIYWIYALRANDDNVVSKITRNLFTRLG